MRSTHWLICQISAQWHVTVNIGDCASSSICWSGTKTGRLGSVISMHSCVRMNKRVLVNNVSSTHARHTHARTASTHAHRGDTLESRARLHPMSFSRCLDGRSVTRFFKDLQLPLASRHSSAHSSTHPSIRWLSVWSSTRSCGTSYRSFVHHVVHREHPFICTSVLLSLNLSAHPYVVNIFHILLREFNICADVQEIVQIKIFLSLSSAAVVVAVVVVCGRCGDDRDVHAGNLTGRQVKRQVGGSSCKCARAMTMCVHIYLWLIHSDH